MADSPLSAATLRLSPSAGYRGESVEVVEEGGTPTPQPKRSTHLFGLTATPPQKIRSTPPAIEESGDTQEPEPEGNSPVLVEDSQQADEKNTEDSQLPSAPIPSEMLSSMSSSSATQADVEYLGNFLGQKLDASLQIQKEILHELKRLKTSRGNP